MQYSPRVYMGIFSDSIYLWHHPMARITRYELHPLATLLAVAILSIAIAALSDEFVGKPVKAMRRRQAPKGAT